MNSLCPQPTECAGGYASGKGTSRPAPGGDQDMEDQDMAYLNFSEIQGAPVSPETARQTFAVVEAPAATLGALEWSVVAIARQDSLSTLSEPSRLSVAFGALFARSRPNPRLADERLEALRRIAVLGWHYGYTIPTEELRAFLAAGFSLDQYELVQDSIGRARGARNARTIQ
jgi:hypothetical protein